jgi:hypothetical protein
MFRRLVIGILLLWLPLQGLAAVTMPFCRHAQAGAAADAAQHHGAGEHAHHAHHQGHSSDGAQHEPAPLPTSMTCNDCGACHLACAAAMLPATALRAAAAVTGQPDAAPPLAPPAHVPDLLNPPPLPRG